MDHPPPAPAAMTLAPATIKHYEIRGKLGEGGFGEVFEAWDSKLCRTVAIKRLRPAATGVADGASLVREARLAASLQHAAFVKIHAIEDEQDVQSIVMEFVPGQTLRAMLRERRPAPDEALRIVHQLALAMREAHASTLVHGDLKPSNVILEPSGAARILDFGLASTGDPQATASLSLLDPQGTIAYMAPERLLGGAPAVPGDIYALGVLLYELLCGERPFAQLSGLALAAAQMQSSSAQWPFPPAADAAVVQLVRDMTARRPEQRLAGMAAVCERIDAIGAGLPAPARRRRRRWPRPAARAMAAGAAAVLLGLAAWQLAPHGSTLPPGPAAAGYSAAQELQRSLAALHTFDRPGSLDLASRGFLSVLEHDAGNAAAAAGLSLAYSFRYAGDGQDSVWLRRADAGAQQALALNDEVALGHAAAALVLLNQDRAEPALAAATRALALDPGDFFALYTRAMSLNRLARYPQALAAAAAGLRLYPQERVFYDEIAHTHELQNDGAAAERAYRQSIAVQPDAVLAYANLSGTLLRQNRTAEALQILQQGLQIRPSGFLYDSLGNALFRAGDYVGAAKAFTHAVAPATGNPANYIYWANLGDTLLWVPGRGAEARRAHQRARELLAPRLSSDPGEVTWVSQMGLYAARVGDGDDARRQMARALAMAPADARTRFRAGLAYELLEDRSAALAEIAKAIQLGYPRHFVESEPDLTALRRDPRYAGADHANAPP
ncbi:MULTISPECIES: protein kinase [unclassified Duganella]|uniref:serine/threonine-protein kinase n=1 Tax=unclassified Duganella TaxID=2636909 RepID=UPI001314CD67|nr:MULTISPECIES: serine/threonine-protein kinase [unclassified Duganella]